MIILDTNVISTLMSSSPNPSVVAWIAGQDQVSLATTAITVAELRFGLERLPAGRRRDELIARFEEFIDRGFRNAIWSFDARAAYQYGILAARVQKAGRQPGFDTQIAAIAVDRGATVATRDVEDFVACGISVINPFAP